MATVKVILESHETEEEVKELLLKALTYHQDNEQYDTTFHQPAARDVFNTMISEHEKMWIRILEEVGQVLDEEVS